MRLGQKVFNRYWQADSEIAESLSGTEFDCWYDDDKIMAFKVEFAGRMAAKAEEDAQREREGVK